MSHEYVYLPSQVYDNKLLLDADPSYISRLELVGSRELVRAWLLGDWNVIAGAFFPEFEIDRHVVSPSELPEWWYRYRACDWGSARHFACVWVAVSDGHLPEFPRGSLIVYRELYGCVPDQPNTGVRWTAEQVGEEIKRLERGDKVAVGVLDPAAFAQDGGPSIMERMARAGCSGWIPADNARVGRNGALGGWDQLRERLRGEPDGSPGIFFFSNCIHTIRTLPALQHDPGRVEDVDTDGEDHLADAVRYGVMHRSTVRTEPRAAPPSDRWRADGRRRSSGYSYASPGQWTG
jgi:hypothetical protein